MIPKKIHYCWFGRNPKPKLAEKCINSWKKYCPDYEIIEWNEDNYDIFSAPIYVRQAYERGKWAFVTDYVRLWAIYNNGGIYLDTDVEMIKPFDSLLHYHSFFGFENNEYVASGLGFGAEKYTPILAEMMDDYNDEPFVLENGELNTIACPERNTAVLLRHGLIQNNEVQTLADGTVILSSDYLSPVSIVTGEKRITENTVSIHWYAASWIPKKEKQRWTRYLKKEKRERNKYEIIIKAKMAAKKTLGEERYYSLKEKLKK